MTNANPQPAQDISLLNGAFVAQQVWSAVLLVAFLLLIIVGLRILKFTRRSAESDDHAPDTVAVSWTRLGTLVGIDNRVSTSRTIALLWTIVVAYCLLALVLIATAEHSKEPVPDGKIPDGFIGAALSPLAPGYIVLLGVPFAAAIGAKVVVSRGQSTGRVQKARSLSGPNPLDLVTDDDGNVDLVDLQYTLFNLIAATYVLTQFIPHPARGLPDVPGLVQSRCGGVVPG